MFEKLQWVFKITCRWPMSPIAFARWICSPSPHSGIISFQAKANLNDDRPEQPTVSSELSGFARVCRRNCPWFQQHGHLRAPMFAVEYFFLSHSGWDQQNKLGSGRVGATWFEQQQQQQVSYRRLEYDARCAEALYCFIVAHSAESRLNLLACSLDVRVTQWQMSSSELGSAKKLLI